MDLDEPGVMGIRGMVMEANITASGQPFAACWYRSPVSRMLTRISWCRPPEGIAQDIR
jgi:hypothetical protein